MARPHSRRSVITGLIALVAAPAIVRAGSLMPVKAVSLTDPLDLGTCTFGWDARTHRVYMSDDHLFFTLMDGNIYEAGTAIFDSALRSAARIAVHNRTE